MNQETLQAKQVVVDELSKKIADSAATVIVEYRGLTVAQLEALRKVLKEKQATFGVYKNTLVSRALKAQGKEGLEQYLEGPNAFIFSKDPIEGPKALAKFARKNDDLKIKAGIIEGSVLDTKGIKEIAALPGRDGLIAMFLSCLQAPVRQFAATVKAIADKGTAN